MQILFEELIIEENIHGVEQILTFMYKRGVIPPVTSTVREFESLQSVPMCSSYS